MTTCCLGVYKYCVTYICTGYMPPTSLSVSYGIELDILGEELHTAGEHY